jgi:hypothetical protein
MRFCQNEKAYILCCFEDAEINGIKGGGDRQHPTWNI